ncbi:MAG: DNA polymerase III subunit alpha [Clostridia bacterium]|nr:DNA polymerase III subunit alpha [Clostridia bacterium]
MAFTHLHVHTEYSLLDGAAQIDKVIARARELGMTSLAITDHGTMFGVVEFYEKAVSAGIKPIIGCEVYTAARTRFDKEVAYDKSQGHLVLLVKNEEGYKNLIKIVSSAYKEGFYYKPRVDHELLRRHNKGIIALSACLAGKVQSELLAGNYQNAKEEALTLLDIYGEGNFYLELQDQGLPEEQKIFADMRRLSEETGIPLVATNDVHYVNKEDAKPHDILLCIQTAKMLKDVDRMRFPNEEFYLKSEKEMRNLFPQVPEAIENTQKIADQCHFDFNFKELHIPDFDVPNGKTKEEFLRELCEVGLVKRYGEKAHEMRSRMDSELATIEKMGYVGYFLIVWDFISYAKKNHIMVGPGRGSAAGSIVAYALEITDIDPIHFGLIFERFLNPDRISMPDIDIDFCVERRQEVIDYVIEKYGADHVAQIATFTSLKAKACIRDVARVMDIPFSKAGDISNMVPNVLDITLKRALETSPDLKKAYAEDIEVAEVIDSAKALEGMPRNSSTHAAGVVISKKPIDEYVPLILSDKGLATQYTMTTIEKLGLLKMDFLGLRNLTVIRDTLDMVKDNTGIEIDFSSMSYDDSAVFKLIASGNTQGIFQLESGGMTQFMKNLNPDCLEDIIAGISLYRPGPMDSIPTYIANKKNPKNVQYATKELEPILSVTYGCMVYQEQVMQIVRDLAGYSYGRSDLVRRAMSKKKAAVMAQERKYFVHGKLDDNGNIDVPGCERNGINSEAANQIFDQMISFAEYAFNKSHAAAYAVIAYQTAYLKAYHPVEFLACLMSRSLDSVAVAGYIRNAREMGIEVLPPDVTKSFKHFSVEDGKIRFGLLAVKNVGEAIINAIVQSRLSYEPTSIFDFIERLDARCLNRKAIESLIRAGALDSFPGNRAQKLGIFEGLVESVQASNKNNLEGQISLFSMESQDCASLINDRELPPANDYDKDDLRLMEKEMLGLYVSNHPLADVASKMEGIIDMDFPKMLEMEESKSLKHRMSVTIGGIITGQKPFVTKKGEMMAFMQVEDLYGMFEVVVFPKVYTKCRDLIAEDKIVIVKGEIDTSKEGAVKILAKNIALLSEYKQKEKEFMVKVEIPESFEEIEGLSTFRDIAKAFRGDVPVAILTAKTGKKFKLDYDLWVRPTDEFYEELRKTFGDHCIRS